MNARRLFLRLDRLEEDVARLVTFLPREEDLRDYVAAHPSEDVLSVAALWWPVLEGCLRRRGYEVSAEDISACIEDLRREAVSRGTGDSSVDESVEAGAVGR